MRVPYRFRSIVGLALKQIDAFIDHPGYDGDIGAPLPGELVPPCKRLPSREYDIHSAFLPHTPSTASRRPGPRSTAAFRGSAVDATGREIVHESLLEYKVGTVLRADTRVAHLQDQPGPKVGYLMGDDVSDETDAKERHTTLDFLVTIENDRTIAVAVKPEGRRERSNIDAVVASVAEHNPDFADEFKVVTERDLGSDQYPNALLILRSRRICTEADLQQLTDVITQIRGIVTIRTLIDVVGGDGRAFAAAVVLLGNGVLEQVDGGRITDRTRVRASRKPSHLQPRIAA